MRRRTHALGRGRARSRIRDVNCFLFQTGDLRPDVLCVQLHRQLADLLGVVIDERPGVLTRVSPYTVRSMAFLPLLRLARTWHCRSPMSPIPPVCGLDDEGNRLDSLHMDRIVVVSPVLGNPALACGVVERAILLLPSRGAAKDVEVELLSRRAEAILV